MLFDSDELITTWQVGKHEYLIYYPAERNYFRLQNVSKSFTE